MNNNILKAIEYAVKDYSKQWKTINERAAMQFWNDKENFTWNDLCDFINSTIYQEYHPTKTALSMLIYLLENDLYNDKHKDKLKKELHILREISNHDIRKIFSIFSHDYQFINYIKSNLASNKYIILKIQNGNLTLKQLELEYIKTLSYNEIYYGLDFFELFPLSNCDISINCYKEIDSRLYFRQADFFKATFKDNEKKLNNTLATLNKFYKWLFRKYDTYNFLENSHNLTNEMIMSNIMSRLLKNDVYFTPFSQTEDLKDRAKICFIIKNGNRYSTRIQKNSHFVLNTSSVKTNYYRTVINKYVQNGVTIASLVQNSPVFDYIIETMHVFEEWKDSENYPNKNKNHFTSEEAILLKEYYENRGLSLATQNTLMGTIRRFFSWCDGNKLFTFDSTFFDFLSQYEEPSKTNGKPINKNELDLLCNTYISECDKDPSISLYFAIFLILLDTEFRISQICNLKVGDLQTTPKSGYYIVKTNTKTSHGRKKEQTVSNSTVQILKKVISDTEELREKVIQPSFKEHIFIKEKQLKPVDAADFLKHFHKICDKAGVKKYSSRNLRDSHMTFSFNFNLKTGGNEQTLSILTGHQNYNTTKNHYIEFELTKMLEATYRVMLNERNDDKQKQIYEHLSNDTFGKETLVENGCGHCNNDICRNNGVMPCLTCPAFITTPEHKPYFINMIKQFDEIIKNTEIEHEIEDFNLRKALYVGWLREICLYEEVNVKC